ncbi:tripartite tricarboxylate transporter permease [Chloroflexota bacterium]
MFEVAMQALAITLDPFRLAMLTLGVCIGLVVGILPGLGGSVSMALVLPFIFGRDPYAAMALLIGAGAVCVTSGTITSILFGIPGTVGSMATIVDGYPMARRGEAGRAIGGAVMASIIGGVLGAVCLILILPIGKPLVLLLGSPELLIMSILGVTIVAILAGKTPLKGVTAAGIGLMLAAIGSIPGNFTNFRYTFHIPYLFDGIPLVVVALGIFAIPEVMDLLIRGTQIAYKPNLGSGMRQGIKDTFTHIGLVVRCAFLGGFIGFVPGLGSSVANWFAYGHAVSSGKDRDNFGKGDIRGVLAPEAANNASTGGALIPTILFGIPGSGMMALLLGGFLMLGIWPGPPMLTEHLDITYSLVWSLALANIIAGILCLVLARPLSRITTIPIHYLAPFVLMAVVLGAFQSTRNWGDLIALLALGILGWFMKQYGWPRPPMLVGFILGGIIERYLFLSVTRYGAEWLLHPGVIIIILASVAVVFLMTRWQTHQPTTKGSEG